MRALCSALALLVLTSGCDDDDGYRSPQTCQLACRRAAQCERVSGDQCSASCGAPGRPTLTLSPKYLDAVRRCLDAQRCETLAGDVCAQEEALRLKPSKAAEDLCRRARDDERVCGRTFDPVSCLDEVKIYDDPSLKRVMRCFDGPCVDHAACVRDTYGFGYPLYP